MFKLILFRSNEKKKCSKQSISYVRFYNTAGKYYSGINLNFLAYMNSFKQSMKNYPLSLRYFYNIEYTYKNNAVSSPNSNRKWMVAFILSLAYSKQLVMCNLIIYCINLVLISINLYSNTIGLMLAILPKYNSF